MNPLRIAAVILAAGKGTRMKSSQAKVLHELFFRPMLHHVIDAVEAAGIKNTALVVGHQRERVMASVAGRSVVPVLQQEQRGTGHAVLCAEAACAAADTVLILCGDTPLIRPETLQDMLRQHQGHEAVLTLMTTELEHPFGYGRVLCDSHGRVLRIVEEKDADAAQRAVRTVNAGIYAVQKDFLFAALRQVGTDNSQGEVYLTDIAGIAARQGIAVDTYAHREATDVLGVNSRVELAQAHAVLQMRRNINLMLAGVTIYSPETVLVAPDSILGTDTVLQAGAQISGQCQIGAGVLIGTGAVLHDCTVGSQAVIGAHCVLRGCRIGEGEQVPPLSARLAG